MSFDKPRRYRRLQRISEIKVSAEGESSNDLELKSRIVSDEYISQMEKNISTSLEKRVTYFYSVFLEKVLTHSSLYVRLLEKDELDVTKVYNLMLEYCIYYINKLRKFDFLALKVEEIMHSIRMKTFKTTYMMDIEEY